MWSVFGYLFIAAIIVFALLGICCVVAYLVARKMHRSLISSIFERFGKYEIVKEVKKEQRKSAIIFTFFLVSAFLVGGWVDGVIYQISTLAAFFFVSITLWLFTVDLRTGRESRIEASTALSLFILFILLMLFLHDDLIEQQSTLEKIKSVAPIFFGFIALFAMVIAFLNYKRKSGVALGCEVQARHDANVLDFYFSNFKDKAVVVYDVNLKFKNMAISLGLKETMVLGAYGANKYRLDLRLLKYAFKGEESQPVYVRPPTSNKVLSNSVWYNPFSWGTVRVKLFIEEIKDKGGVIEIQSNYGIIEIPVSWISNNDGAGEFLRFMPACFEDPELMQFIDNMKRQDIDHYNSIVRESDDTGVALTKIFVDYYTESLALNNQGNYEIWTNARRDK